MIDQYTNAIKYDGFKKANFLSELKAKIVLKGRKKMFFEFMEFVNPNEKTRVLDAGVAPVKGIKGVKTVTNNFFEFLYPYKNNITATSIEDASYLESIYPGLSFVQTEPYLTPFDDREYDVVFSNAVVEHVGDRNHQRKFIEEYCRISKSFFFTTPNRWFPIEPHSAMPFIHWFPPKIFRFILKHIGMKGLADENILNLLSAKEFMDLFPNGTKVELVRVKTFGITSNLIVKGMWL